MSLLSPEIFAHFRPEERPFIERSLDLISRALDKYQPVTTPFLDPREQYILSTLARREPELVLFQDGGFPSAERKRAVVGPSYVTADPELFRLSFLRLETVTGNRLEHPDVLGAVLGLGIKRERVGDIIPHSSGADVVIAREMCEFVRIQLGQVGRHHVTINEISRDDLVLPEQKFSLRTVTVASLRVDALVSEACRISRAKAAALIKNGKCKVNWKIVDQPDYSLEAGDMISLRGYGRVRIESIEGLTKKGRNLVQIASFI